MSTPADCAAVMADNFLLDLTGAGWPLSEGNLPRILVAWRCDVDAEPVGELVDIDTALAAISAGRGQ